jgi:DNA-binding HxlR family transcriptional regulator
MAATRDCTKLVLPIRDTLELLHGKWKIPIIAALLADSQRFKELQRDLPGITAKTLSKELKEMEANQLVFRTEHATSPPTVTYSLTEYSRSLEPVIEALYDWGVQHRARIMG